MATQYLPGPLIGTAENQHLATGYPVGKRFHSAPVLRVADAKPVQLGHVHRADGAWRLYVFEDESGVRFGELMEWLSSDASVIRLFTPVGEDDDSVIDVRAVLRGPYDSIDPSRLPDALRPEKGPFALRDYEKAFTRDSRSGPDIFDVRGIDAQGAMILVRPDQFVAQLLPLTARAELVEFLVRAVLRQLVRLSGR